LANQLFSESDGSGGNETSSEGHGEGTIGGRYSVGDSVYTSNFVISSLGSTNPEGNCGANAEFIFSKLLHT